MTRLATFLAAALLVASLAGCRTPIAEQLNTTPNAGPCPAAGSLYDAARIVRFADPAGPVTYGNIAYTGEITDVRLYCRYTGGEPLVAEIEVDFAFGKGPKGEAARMTYPYFVAVTRRNGKVLAKEVFTAEADFRRASIAKATELVNRIQIPRADETISGVNFEVIVGFELSPQELEFNRSGQRFRLDAS